MGDWSRALTGACAVATGVGLYHLYKTPTSEVEPTPPAAEAEASPEAGAETSPETGATAEQAVLTTEAEAYAIAARQVPPIELDKIADGPDKVLGRGPPFKESCSIGDEPRKEYHFESNAAAKLYCELYRRRLTARVRAESAAKRARGEVPYSAVSNALMSAYGAFAAVGYMAKRGVLG